MPRREIRLGADLTTAAAPAAPTPSRWGPFSHLAFTVIWTASLVSNVGTAMFDTASGWLITSLDANPITVSLVQVAVSLPLFLFTLPSGALADVIDSRRLLIAVEVAILAVSVVFAGLVSLNLATPSLLLYEGVADGGRFIETFSIESWLEVLHQRERATNADEMLRSRVRQLLKEAPRITFGVSPERPHRHWRKRAGEPGR
jgi:hypothetical protein